MAVIVKRHLAQELADAPVVFFGLVGALCWFHKINCIEKQKEIPVREESLELARRIVSANQKSFKINTTNLLQAS